MGIEDFIREIDKVVLFELTPWELRMLLRFAARKGYNIGMKTESHKEIKNAVQKFKMDRDIAKAEVFYEDPPMKEKVESGLLRLSKKIIKEPINKN